MQTKFLSMLVKLLFKSQNKQILTYTLNLMGNLSPQQIQSNI